MNIIRYNDPFAGLEDMHRTMDDVFRGVFGGLQSPANLSSTVDVYEEDNALHTEVAVPGYDKKDIEVNIHDGVLEVKGEKTSKEEKDKKRSYVLRETSSSFYRRIALPKQADADKVEAHFDNGVLKVTVPYKELPAPKKIDIKSKK